MSTVSIGSTSSSLTARPSASHRPFKIGEQMTQSQTWDTSQRRTVLRPPRSAGGPPRPTGEWSDAAAAPETSSDEASRPRRSKAQARAVSTALAYPYDIHQRTVYLTGIPRDATPQSLMMDLDIPDGARLILDPAPFRASLTGWIPDLTGAYSRLEMPNDQAVHALLAIAPNVPAVLESRLSLSPYPDRPLPLPLLPPRIRVVQSQPDRPLCSEEPHSLAAAIPSRLEVWSAAVPFGPVRSVALWPAMGETAEAGTWLAHVVFHFEECGEAFDEAFRQGIVDLGGEGWNITLHTGYLTGRDGQAMVPGRTGTASADAHSRSVTLSPPRPSMIFPDCPSPSLPPP